MSNQDWEMEMGSGVVLHWTEYQRLEKAVRRAVRLGAPAAVLEVSSSGIRFFAADDPTAPAWWLDAMFGQPFATAGRALIASPQKVVEALQRAVGERAGDVRVLPGSGAVRFAGPSGTATMRARAVPYGAGERRIPARDAWFNVNADRIAAAASLTYALLVGAVNVAAPRRAPDVWLRLARGPGPRGEWVLEVAGDVLRHPVPVVVGVPPKSVPVVGRYPFALLNGLLTLSIDGPLMLEFTEPVERPALRVRWVEADWSVEFRVAPAPG